MGVGGREGVGWEGGTERGWVTLTEAWKEVGGGGGLSPTTDIHWPSTPFLETPTHAAYDIH